MKSAKFSIGLTADFYDENGNTLYEDIGLDVFEGFDHVVVSKIAGHTTEITSDQLLDTLAGRTKVLYDKVKDFSDGKIIFPDEIYNSSLSM